MKPAAPVTKTAFGMFSPLPAATPRNEATSPLPSAVPILRILPGLDHAKPALDVPSISPRPKGDLDKASFLEQISLEIPSLSLDTPKFLKPLFCLVDIFNQGQRRSVREQLESKMDGFYER
jgi:hypothetical protein